MAKTKPETSCRLACTTCGYDRTDEDQSTACTGLALNACRCQPSCTPDHRVDAEYVPVRPRRDCQHPGGPHRHGARAAYQKDGCRCPDCTRANADVEHRRRRATAYGRWAPYIDASPTRAHLLRLRAAGIGVRRIADAVGSSYSHIADLARLGDDGAPLIRRVRAETERRILAIPIDPAYRSPGCRVDATGTRRRIQALVAVGYTPAILAPMLAIKPSQLSYLLDRGAVTARTARQVSEIYETLWDALPPTTTDAERGTSERAREWARQRRWLPPLTWDDIDNDTAPATRERTTQRDDVDEIAVERALVGDGVRLAHLTQAEQKEVVRRLTDTGMSIRDIAQLLGTTSRTISRRRVTTRAA